MLARVGDLLARLRLPPHALTRGAPVSKREGEAARIELAKRRDGPRAELLRSSWEC